MPKKVEKTGKNQFKITNPEADAEKKKQKNKTWKTLSAKEQRDMLAALHGIDDDSSMKSVTP
jgi:hypothetical protein